MTVGGTGDVLSGLSAALLSKLPPFEAALLGAYMNGVAGNLAMKKVGLHMVATDIIDSLPLALKPLDKVM
jgi:NAD(P)H-hydrate epimerase